MCFNDTFCFSVGNFLIWRLYKETSGKSAKDWIVEYIILEIKALLKNTSLNIQEIAIKTNFANQSSLGRFFRKHTGMSLSQYRMSNLEQ